MSMFSSAFKSMYMHMCVCVESWKRGLALSITKKQGVHTAYNSVKEKKRKTEARWNRTICVSISPLSTGSDFWKKGLSPLSRLIKERICSKQLYLNLSCLLPPLHRSSLANQFIGPCGPQVFMHWRYEHNEPKGGRPQIKWRQRALMR